MGNHQSQAKHPSQIDLDELDKTSPKLAAAIKSLIADNSGISGDKSFSLKNSLPDIVYAANEFDSDDSTRLRPQSLVGSAEFSTVSTQSPAGSAEFKHEVVRTLGPIRHSLCIQGDEANADIASWGIIEAKDSSGDDLDFDAAFEPSEMRCIALVSHNEMKPTMKHFVIQYKHVLKKFRLSGTKSTMKMLAEVFADEPDVEFGPACKSGPLGGDAELVALMTSGKLGGILFFQDPLTSHPHQCDIDCLVRQAVVHNTLMANTPTTAMACMEVFKRALMGVGRPELIPSFFFDLQSPTVEAYENNQERLISLVG